MAGFRQVGRDFPVFLHPETHEEYALARTERKSGRGYHGFSIDAAPEVTLEQDLARRDLTINAMARTPEGEIVDPYGGRDDLEARVLRHVSPAFSEDPLLAQIFLTEFVATQETMQAMYEADPRPSAFLPVLDATEDDDLVAFGEAGVNALPMPAIPEMSAVWSAWGDAMELIITQAEDPEPALETAAQQIETAIAGE